MEVIDKEMLISLIITESKLITVLVPLKLNDNSNYIYSKILRFKYLQPI